MCKREVIATFFLIRARATDNARTLNIKIMKVPMIMDRLAV